MYHVPEQYVILLLLLLLLVLLLPPWTSLKKKRKCWIHVWESRRPFDYYALLFEHLITEKGELDAEYLFHYLADKGRFCPPIKAALFRFQYVVELFNGTLWKFLNNAWIRPSLYFRDIAEVSLSEHGLVGRERPGAARRGAPCYRLSTAATALFEYGVASKIVHAHIQPRSVQMLRQQHRNDSLFLFARENTEKSFHLKYILSF